MSRFSIVVLLFCLQVLSTSQLCCLALNAEDKRECAEVTAIPDLKIRLKRLDTYLLRHPKAARLYGYRAEVHNALGNTDATIADANKYFDLNKEPVVAQICKVRANAYLKKGEKEKALADLTLAKKLAPKDGEGALMLGMVLERMGRNEEALVEYGRSIELKFFRAYSNRAELELRMPKLKEGLADSLAYMRLTKDLKLQDTILSKLAREKKYSEQLFLCAGFIKAGMAERVCYSTKANALFELKRYPEALQACDQSFRICGDRLDRLRYLILMAEKESDKAAAQLRAMIKDKPHDLQLYLWRADCYILNQNYDLALADLIRANALVLKNKDALAKRGECYFRLGKYAEAVRDYALVNGSGARAETLSNEALCRKGLKDYDGAIDCFSRALKLKPLSSILLHYRAECYFRRHDYKKAEADLTDAIVLDPKNSAYYYARATYRHQAGSFEDAVRDYTVALGDPRLHGLAYQGRAKSYRSLGQVNLAEKDEKAAATASKSLEGDLFK